MLRSIQFSKQITNMQKPIDNHFVKYLVLMGLYRFFFTVYDYETFGMKDTRRIFRIVMDMIQTFLFVDFIVIFARKKLRYGPMYSVTIDPEIDRV